jgi:hypothetical protein
VIWPFVKWKSLRVWHVDRGDGRTHCGQLLDQPARVDRMTASSPSGTLCTICKRLRRSQGTLPGVRP